jgi:PAS domain S-box-containing protein
LEHAKKNGDNNNRDAKDLLGGLLDIVKVLLQPSKTSNMSQFLREAAKLVADYFSLPFYGFMSVNPDLPEVIGNIPEKSFRDLEKIINNTKPAKVTIINDTLPEPWGEIARIGYKNLIIIPVTDTDELQGALVFPDKKRHDFSDKAIYQMECSGYMVSNTISLGKTTQPRTLESDLQSILSSKAIMIVDEDEKIITVSESFCHLAGCHSVDLVGKIWNDNDLIKPSGKDLLPDLKNIDSRLFPASFDLCIGVDMIDCFSVCNISSKNSRKYFTFNVIAKRRTDISPEYLFSEDDDLGKEIIAVIEKIIQDSDYQSSIENAFSTLGAFMGEDRISIVSVSQGDPSSVNIPLKTEIQWCSDPKLAMPSFEKQPYMMSAAKLMSGLPVGTNIHSTSSGMSSIMILPAFVNGKLWGFLCVESLTKKNVWSDTQKKYISLFGQFVADQVESGKQLSIIKRDLETNKLFLLGFTTSIGIMSMKDNKFIDISNGFTNLTGWTREEVLGKTTLDLGLYANRHQRDEFFDQIKINGRVIDKEILLRTKDGSTKTVLLSGEVVYSNSQKILIARQQDITRIREIELELKKNEERVKTIIRSIPERILVVDENGMIVEAENGLELESVIPPEMLIGRSLESVLPTDIYNSFTKNREETKQKKETHIFEFEIGNSQLTKKYFETSLALTNSNDLVAVIRDVTESRISQYNLDKAKEKFYKVFHFSPLGVVIIDSHYLRIIDCNRRFIRLTDSDFTTIIGEQIDHIQKFSNNPRFGEFLEQLSKDRSNTNFEIEFNNSKKMPVYCLLNATSANIGGDDVYIITISDISELKQIKNDLAQSDERFRTTVMNINFPSILIDCLTGKVIMCNEDFSKMACLPSQVIESGTLTSLGYFTPSDYENLVSDLKEYGTIKNRIDTFNLPDGNKLEVIYSSEIIKYQGNECILGTFQDISPLKNAGKAILESEERYRLLVENSPLGTMIVDFEGNIISINKSMLAMIQYADAKGIIDTNIRDHLVFGDCQLHEDLEECIRLMDTVISEKSLKISSSNLNVVVYSTPYSNPEGTTKRIQMVFEDITITKMVEQELKKAISQAESASSAKSEFLANMSHEIRTPLNALLGFVQLLSADTKDEKQKQYISAIETAAQVLNSMTGSLLDISKIEAGKISIELSPQDIATLVRDSILLVEQKSEETGNIIHFVFDNQPSVYMIDPDRFKQVMINLLGNAQKFTKNGSITVDMKIEKSDLQKDKVLIEVDDSGIGIPKEMRETVFEPFMQVDSSATRKFGGSGLGLAIVKGLVERMGGNISIVDKKTPGAKFRIELELERVMSQQIRVAKSKDAIICLKDDKAFDVINDIFIKTSLTLHRQDAIPENLKYIKMVITDTVDESMLAEIEKGNLPPFIVIGRNDSGEKWIGIPDPVDKNAALVAISRLFPEEPELAYLNLIGKKILIVEDNQLNVMLLKDILTRMGCVITVSMSGTEAVDLIKQGGFDACLMDVQMPDLSGLDATMQVRYFEETTTRNRLPIIALTAYATSEDREKCLNAGMDDFVAKPFRMGELLSTLTTAIHKSLKENQKGIIQKLAERLLIDPEKLREFLGNFIKSSLKSLESVDELINNNDYAAALKITHTIKGMAYVEDLHKSIVKLEGSMRKQDKEMVMIELLDLKNNLKALSKEISS